MPEQDDVEVSKDSILNNNTIQDNQTNYIFDPKKDEYELLYAQDDDPPTIGTYEIYIYDASIR